MKIDPNSLLDRQWPDEPRLLISISSIAFFHRVAHSLSTCLKRDKFLTARVFENVSK